MKPTILLPLILLSTPAVLAQQADNRSPEQMLKATIGGVMDAIRSDPAARAGDLARTYQLVQQRFLPSTDFMLTTQYAVGSAWAKATPAQREALFQQFQTLLARTYAIQLTQIQGQDTRFQYAPTARLAPDATDAVVKNDRHHGRRQHADRLPHAQDERRLEDLRHQHDGRVDDPGLSPTVRAAAGVRRYRWLIKYLAAHNEGA